MDTFHHLHEALHMLQRRISLTPRGIKQYHGNAENICAQIINGCWNGTFFQVSTGHFSLFYMRDFGMCVEALIKQGYKEEVKKTLQFALCVYSRENRVATTITKKGKAFDVFSYAPDSLAFLLYSLRISNNKELVEIYKPFLEQQILFFYDTVFDKETGLVTKKRDFSSIKDHAKRRSTCYDNCCLAVVAREIDILGLKNPFADTGFSYKQIQEKIKKTFWTGEYFLECNAINIITGDANTFPYWFKIFTDKEMIQKSIAAIQKEKLDQPFPLKYTSAIPKNFFTLLKIAAPNYEGNSIWMHLGLCYVDVVAQVDKRLAKKYIFMYKQKIEEHKNFLELFTANGEMYKTFFYHADEEMLWASKYIALHKTL